MEEKITFKQLSTPIKIAIISSYIVGSIYGLAFIVGMIQYLLLE